LSGWIWSRDGLVAPKFNFAPGGGFGAGPLHVRPAPSMKTTRPHASRGLKQTILPLQDFLLLLPLLVPDKTVRLATKQRCYPSSSARFFTITQNIRSARYYRRQERHTPFITMTLALTFNTKLRPQQH